MSLAALNYEDTSSYTLKVNVSDGTLYDVNYLYINITDVNEAPVIWNLAHEMDVNETETGLLFAVNATDPDGDVLTYTVRVIRPPATGPATFTVDLTGNSRTAMAASMKGRPDTVYVRRAQNVTGRVFGKETAFETVCLHFVFQFRTF